MQYPKDFVERCKAVYPDWEMLHKLLDSHNRFAGRLLDDSRGGTIPSEALLECKNLEELENLKTLAKKLQEKDNLYREWCKIDDEQTPKIY